MKYQLQMIIVVGAAMALAGAAVGQAAEAEEWGKPADLLGKDAPVVKLPLLGGGEVNSAALKGQKTLVLDFWASWCPWCRKATDRFDQLSQAYSGKDIEFYVVAVGQKAEPVEAYLKTAPAKVKFALDADRAVSDKYWVDYIPHVVVIDPEGKIVLVSVGQEKTSNDLEAYLKQRYPDVTPPAPTPDGE